MDWFATTFWAAIRPVFWGLTRTPLPERNPDEIEAARKKTAGLLAIVDEALIGRPYLAGDDFGMGDIPMGCAIWRWYGLDIERPRYANLEAWFARLSERPAYSKNVLQPLT
jgi:glutathione S-transferase